MFCLFLRLVRVSLPAIFLAEVWGVWWLLSDGPIKISRPDVPVNAVVQHMGPETVLESGVPSIGFAGLAPAYWRLLDTGKHIVDPALLQDGCVNITADEQTLAVFRLDQPLRLFDRGGGSYDLPRVRSLPVQPPIYFQDDTPPPLRSIFAYDSVEGALVVDALKREVSHRFRELHAPMAVSNDGQLLVAARNSASLVCIDLRTQKEIASLPYPHQDQLHGMKFTADKRRILIWTNYDADESDSVWSLDPPGHESLKSFGSEHNCNPMVGGRYAMIRLPGHVDFVDLSQWPPTHNMNGSGVSRRRRTELSDGSNRGFSVIIRGVYPHRTIEDLSWRIFGRPIANQRDEIQIVDANDATMRVIPRTLPPYYRLGADPSTIWMSASQSKLSHNGTFELWSVTPPRPPWWLWTLSMMCVIWQWKVFGFFGFSRRGAEPAKLNSVS